jgi:hypothetical protein
MIGNRTAERLRLHRGIVLQRKRFLLCSGLGTYPRGRGPAVRVRREPRRMPGPAIASRIASKAMPVQDNLLYINQLPRAPRQLEQ